MCVLARRTKALCMSETCKYNDSRSGGLPAIVPLHLALVAIELVVGAANKLTLPAAYLVTERGGATMLCRNLNHPLAAGLALQMAEGPEWHTSAYMTYIGKHPSCNDWFANSRANRSLYSMYLFFIGWKVFFSTRKQFYATHVIWTFDFKLHKLDI